MTFINDLMTRVWLGLRSLKDERGQDLLEYALLGGGIALAIILGFVLFSDAVTAMVQGIRNCIDFNNSANSVCSPGW